MKHVKDYIRLLQHLDKPTLCLLYSYLIIIQYLLSSYTFYTCFMLVSYNLIASLYLVNLRIRHF